MSESESEQTNDDLQSLDAVKLRGAIKNIRAEKKAAETALKAAQGRLEILTQEVAALKAVSNPTSEALQQRIEEVAALKVRQQTSTLDKRLASLGSELEAAKQSTADITARHVLHVARTAATAAHVLPEALGLFETLAKSELAYRDGNIVDKDGNDVAQWINSKKSTFGYAWPRSRGTGAGGHRAFDIVRQPAVDEASMTLTQRSIAAKEREQQGRNAVVA